MLSLVLPMTRRHTTSPSNATGRPSCGFSPPFPGSVHAAFRKAQAIKAKYPGIVTVLGGGYVNTDVRAWFDDRVPRPRVGRHFIARALAGDRR